MREDAARHRHLGDKRGCIEATVLRNEREKVFCVDEVGVEKVVSRHGEGCKMAEKCSRGVRERGNVLEMLFLRLGRGLSLATRVL
jgi:hypothetical protein